MILRETEEAFILVEQHHHAVISGVFARCWATNYFLGGDQRQSVEFAIEQHDSCWQELDKRPIYLSDSRKPASFIDYPLQDKISAYKRGVNAIVNQDPYAALLISFHYSSFFQGKINAQGKAFKESEERRQSELMEIIPVKKEELQFHFDLLQLCDNLSLYICMNKWGSSKKEEISWFRDGYPQQLKLMENKKLYTAWDGEEKVKIHPYPFSKSTITVSIPYKKITKEILRYREFATLYKKVPYRQHRVTFVPFN